MNSSDTAFRDKFIKLMQTQKEMTTQTGFDMSVDCITVITSDDENLIQQWLNCDEASVDVHGDVWVSGPMNGHWLNTDNKAKFVEWRAKFVAGTVDK